MSKPQICHDATGILSSQPGSGHLHAYGTSVPTDASSGYAPGCIFTKTNGSAGSVHYINQGSATSCDFNALDGSIADALTSSAFLNVGLGGAILAAGTPMAAFADNAASQPGITLANSKAVGLRWNNNATQVAVWLNPIVAPANWDTTANATLKILASKTGATSGDATTFTVSAFNNASGALHDADSDFGGTSSAMTGAATAKTIQLCTLTLATADLAANPNVISMSIKPTDGTLGTDDVIVHGVWIEYKRKLLTA